MKLIIGRAPRIKKKRAWLYVTGKLLGTMLGSKCETMEV